MDLTGLHHVTAITARPADNRRFYTGALGLRLVKKTVNQDDTTAYHLFYADAQASPGSDLTFFDFPVPPAQRGTHSIVTTALRVTGQDSLAWWLERLRAEGAANVGEIEDWHGRAALRFEDAEGQRLVLVDDGGAGEGHAWDRSPVPPEHQIRGLGPITISVPDLRRTRLVLEEVMNMRETGSYPAPGSATNTVHVFSMGPGGVTAEIHVAVEPGLPFAREGAGAVHHVAFRTPDREQLTAWAERTRMAGLRTSGEVERYYFRSLYFREPNGILFEIATDGPGFTVDEPLESLGEKLSLPPFLEPNRAQIEANLKPI